MAESTRQIAFVRGEDDRHPSLPPPMAVSGPIVWMRENLFSSVGNTILTLVALYLIYLIVPGLINWALIDAIWTGTSFEDCRNPDGTGGAGACWAMIDARFGQFIYGYYPAEERWRVNLTFLIFFISIVPLLYDRVPGRKQAAIFIACIFPFLAFFLLYGGIGLTVVPTYAWGGLTLTLLLACTAILVSLPLGIILALGRRATNLPVISMLCTAFIELIRAVPLITVLFMANFMLPLFLPEGVNFDALMRALVGVSLFAAAYMAEVVRGGLQALPSGQMEAARSMGLSYWLSMRLIMLPQALKIVIPGIVNTFIGLFKDTSLVSIIGLLDLLLIAKQSVTDKNWLGTEHTAYAFAALLYFIFCFSMSRYSLWLEAKLHTGHKR